MALYQAQGILPDPIALVTSVKYYLSSVPLIQALIADLKSTLSWAISGDSLCCLMHYFHLNQILLGTQWFKSKEELLMVRFSGIKPE